ncbi:MAG TPA: RNA polymerase sigma-54 factor [Acidobacteriaceae bacterium]|nr:RNA polymerase sigma-54 factor [Acidobacteriaceae bacterium]
MALLQPRLNLKVAQKQVLTPGLVQMVSLLALNKQELKEMIDAEILENPVLEELDESVPSIDDVRTPEEADPAVEAKSEERDPFDEIDFGSYFQDYLDPGYRTPNSTEISERPSFENFLSKASTLTDHLMWQLGSLHLSAAVREAAELIVGNLNEDGYLTATDEELLAALSRGNSNGHHASNGHNSGIDFVAPKQETFTAANGNLKHWNGSSGLNGSNGRNAYSLHHAFSAGNGVSVMIDRTPEEMERHQPSLPGDSGKSLSHFEYPAALREQLTEALNIVRRLDPVGIAARDLKECLLVQLDSRTQEAAALASSTLRLAASAEDYSEFEENGAAGGVRTMVAASTGEGSSILALARRIIDQFLPHLLKRDIRELARLTGTQQSCVQAAIEAIRGLDPKPGQRYNREQVRLIEPDVAFIKRDGEYVIMINDEEMPTLRLNQGYRRMLNQVGTEREVKDYVKERYRSAIQLMRNIEQRKNTILRTCEVIIRRQREFLEEGVDSLKPMMIKDVAEEIGVHASTVSRAVANKYVHTPQGVYELRFFFTEGVNGPEGADTPLLLLKRKVKKLIEEEDSGKPLTDEALANILQAQGIAVNRRTVAKYREDMGIPSTHQRRVRI